MAAKSQTPSEVELRSERQLQPRIQVITESNAPMSHAALQEIVSGAPEYGNSHDSESYARTVTPFLSSNQMTLGAESRQR